jgi:hypothetical protein
LDIFPDKDGVGLARGGDAQMHQTEKAQRQDHFERRTPEKAGDSQKHAKQQGEYYGRHFILLRSVAMRPLQRRLDSGYSITKTNSQN